MIILFLLNFIAILMVFNLYFTYTHLKDARKFADGIILHMPNDETRPATITFIFKDKDGNIIGGVESGRKNL